MYFKFEKKLEYFLYCFLFFSNIFLYKKFDTPNITITEIHKLNFIKLNAFSMSL